MTEKQTLSELLDRREYGDMNKVGKILGVTRHNADRLLKRETAKRHPEAVEALRKVIAANDSLLEDNN